MGMSSDAKLVYGYDLGGDASEWLIRETGEYGGLAVDWYDIEAVDGIDFREAMVDRIKAAGLVDDDWDGFLLDGQPGDLRFVYYSYEWGAHILATHEVESGSYGSAVVDLAELAAHPDIPEWDAKLAAAIAAIGITPTQDRPRWILCSSYG